MQQVYARCPRQLPFEDDDIGLKDTMRAEKRGGIGKAVDREAAFRQLGNEGLAVVLVVFNAKNANSGRSADIGGQFCGALFGNSLHVNHHSTQKRGAKQPALVLYRCNS
jgi:hypothetical protein